MREQGVGLEDGVDVALVRRRPGNGCPEMSNSPAVGSSKPASMRRVVVLPQPLGPSKRHELPRLDLEVDVVDGSEVAELLDDVDKLDGALVPGRTCLRLSLLAASHSIVSWCPRRRRTVNSCSTGSVNQTLAPIGSRSRPSRDLVSLV